MTDTERWYERGDVRIRYVDTGGSGAPLLIIPGGGLNSSIAALSYHPFDPIPALRDEFRLVICDLRNANGGESVGPLEVERPWDSHTDDQVGVMDHLGIDTFMVLGFC